MFREEKRQIVHILLFLLAFLLKYLNRWQAFVLLGLLLFITLFVAPKLRARSHLYRFAERRYSRGAVSYFLILLVLVLVFPLYIVAVSWAILALGDGTATLFGRHFRAKELPWNKNKTYAGSLAFIIFGTIGAFILLKWMLPGIGSSFSIALKTTIVAAIAESLPFKFDDNVTVAVTSAVVLYLLV